MLFDEEVITNSLACLRALAEGDYETAKKVARFFNDEEETYLILYLIEFAINSRMDTVSESSIDALLPDAKTCIAWANLFSISDAMPKLTFLSMVKN